MNKTRLLEQVDQSRKLIKLTIRIPHDDYIEYFFNKSYCLKLLEYKVFKNKVAKNIKEAVGVFKNLKKFVYQDNSLNYNLEDSNTVCYCIGDGIAPKMWEYYINVY